MYLSSAIQTIKAHCLKHDDCINCMFAEHDSTGVSCSLRYRAPLQWDMIGTEKSPSNIIDDVISFLMIEFEITKEQATTLFHLLHITINSFKES